MRGIPRRHHFVTKAYLDVFLEPNEKLLYCYGRKRPEAFRAAPENLANIRDYHSVRRQDGSLDFSLETRIEQEIETPGIPLIRRLSAGKTNLDTGQRLSLAKLIGLQNVRVPYERDFIDKQNREILAGYLADMDEDARRRGVPVNEIDIAISVTDKEPRPGEWVRVRREYVEAQLEAIRDDPERFSRENFFKSPRSWQNTTQERSGRSTGRVAQVAL
jgi:hypothetical protein